MSDVSQSLTYVEAAALAGKNRETIARWVLKGVQGRKLRAFKKPGDNRNYVRREDLDAFLRPTPVAAHSETVEEWAKRVAASAPPMTSEQAQYVMSALRHTAPIVTHDELDQLVSQGGAAA